jgi:CRISPR system Cascade subunit CasC
MTIRTYIDVHVIQALPPSNVNRDDNGTPKQAVYGGVRRARVSSQAWKRATRLGFADYTDLPTDFTENRATRTKRIAAVLQEKLVARAGITMDQAQRLSAEILHPLGIKANQKAGKEHETSYLLFFGTQQVESIVDLVAAQVPELISLTDKELTDALKQLDVKAALQTGHPLDVALFGRMVADQADLNVDAAVQVAHAISTHAVDIEFDYFTAVDDENLAGETGAGMIGTVEFNSSTLYRYATIGLHQLSRNLLDEEASVQAVRAFVASFVRSVPSGHQNSFAHQTLPSAVVVSVRGDQPINLVTAFEEPVSSETGTVSSSTDRLAKELDNVSTQWALTPLHTLATYSDQAGKGFQTAFPESTPFPVLLDELAKLTAQRLSAEA